MSEAAFDELLRRLVAADVRFVLVGGLAVNSWGVVRGTKDVDVVVDQSPDNIERLTDLVLALNGVVQRTGSVAGSRFSIGALLSGAERVHIQTDLGHLDVVRGLDGVPPYDQLQRRAVDVDVLGITVAVCSLEDLKAMKLAAGRTRDLADVEDLEDAHGKS